MRAAEKTRLTAREVEVYVWLKEGYSDKEIAGALTISQRTVQSHLQKIYRKLNVRNRTAAILKGRQQ